MRELQVILAILLAWGVSAILTACGVFSADSEDRHYLARADAKIQTLVDAQWIRVPYPCKLREIGVSPCGERAGPCLYMHTDREPVLVFSCT